MKPTSIQQLAKELCQLPLLLSLLGLALIVPPAGYAAAPDNVDRATLSAPTVQAGPEIRSGEILVKFEAGVSSLAIETTNQNLGVSVIEMISEFNLYRLRIPEETTIAEMIELYQHTAGVAYAEPNYIAHALETIPDDPRFDEQWALEKIEAPAAWDIITGTDDIVIAIIDTGIDYNHPDLNGGRYMGGYDFINEDDDPIDDEGHGTHVTGIATADTNNGEGIAGLAWNSRFMGVKVLDAEGSGTYFDLAQGIRYAADNNAHAANMSLGGPEDSHTLEEAMQYAYDAGVVMACAAGNSYGPGVSYPAVYTTCLAVAATDPNDDRAIFSSYGPEVDVAAPGVNILSTTGGDYESKDGTSMATPHVTGLAALILAQDPELSVDQVFAAIRDSADDVNAETHPGEDDYLGTGRINAYRALLALATLVRIEPPDTTVRIGSPFTVTASILNVTDLGGFQFELTYDPTCVEAIGATLGPFLGSTGRSVAEVGPTFEPGSVTYGAYSFGADPGPNGDGVLATITLEATSVGTSTLHLQDVVATDTIGVAIAVGTQDGNVRVTCHEDVNGDGVINIVDIQLVAARWNTAEGDPDYDPLYDINEDGVINIVDIQLVAAKWHTPC